MNKNRIIEDYLQGKHPVKQESWELPTEGELERDKALYDALLAERTTPLWLHLGVRWFFGIAVAASILLLLVFRFSQETVEEQPVEAVSIVAEATSQPVPQPIYEEKKEEVLAEVQPMTKLVSKHRKTVMKQSVQIEEPVLAQAEQPIQEQGQDIETMYAQAEEYDTHYQNILTVHLSSDVVMHVIEASDMPTATSMPSVSELRARGLRLTNNVRQASLQTVQF